MNFGCGTLIALLLLVIVAGKLIPHGPATPSPQQGVQKGGKPQAAGGLVPKEKLVKPSPSVLEEPQARSFEEMLSGLKTWVEEKAMEAEHNVLTRAALPAGAGPAAEVLAKVGEETKTLVTQRIAEVALPQAAPTQPAPSEKVQVKSPPAHRSPSHPVASPSSGVKLAVEGRDPVFNNPWNHAVEPVERYLKQHVHDAASIEVLEWGQVEVAREGYQVRCVYKSKNVLGKMTTQGRLFVLDHSGKVIDIRD
jgi:hypothetical protein